MTTNRYGLGSGELWWEALLCKGCEMTTYMYVVAEGPKRIVVVCADCGRRRFIHSPDVVVRGGGGWNTRTDLDAERIAADYLAGDSISVLRERYHCGTTAIVDRLEQQGVQRRDSVTESLKHIHAAKEKHVQLRREQGRRTIERVLALKAEGLRDADVARELGVTQTCVYLAQRRAREAVA